MAETKRSDFEMEKSLSLLHESNVKTQLKQEDVLYNSNKDKHFGLVDVILHSQSNISKDMHVICKMHKLQVDSIGQLDEPSTSVAHALTTKTGTRLH